MPPNRFESEVESFLEGSHGDRTHNKQRADHHTVTPLCGTLLTEMQILYREGASLEEIDTIPGYSVGTLRTYVLAAGDRTV